MKNKFLIGLLAFFAAIFTIVIFLNLSHSNSIKDYSFNRKFSKNEILKFENKYNLLGNDNTYQLFSSTRESIVEGKLKEFESEESNYDLFFSDGSFSNKTHKVLKLPISNVLLIDKNYTIYSHNKNLYQLDLATNFSIKTTVKNINVCSIIRLYNMPNMYLFFGGAFLDNTYKTGFFVLDMLNNKIIESKIIQSDSASYRLDTITMYAGYFQKTADNSLIYTCERNPMIFIFNSKGVSYKEIMTKDNTPMPKIIKNSRNMYFFSHDGSTYTNSGVFTDNDNLFVFSMASKFRDKIIIDQYSKKTKKYVQSYKLSYNNYNSNDIANVIIDKDKLILKFESNYASFKFSRYTDGNFY